MCDKNLTIDKEKCIHCGLCLNDCMAKCLEFDSEKFPQFAPGGEERCIKCQHCLAICPTGALSIVNKNPENSAPIKNSIHPDDLFNLIQSRRSFRHYENKNLDKDTLNKLKNMLNYVPTGVNNHGLLFSFIDDVKVMDEYRENVNKKIIETVSNGENKDITEKFSRYKNAILNGEDIIFRGAPHMVVVSSPKDAPCAAVDPMIALSYFELYAQCLGVATCWCGLAYGCLDFFPEFCKPLEIPQNYKPQYAMLFGPPKVKYARAIQPEPYKMISVKG